MQQPKHSGVRPVPIPAPAVMPRTTSQGATPLGALEKVHQLIILVIRLEIVEIIVPFVVFELGGPLSEVALKAAIESKLLTRFPRFRGHVSADELHWCVPEHVDPADYVVPVELQAKSQADEHIAVREYVQQQMRLPLPYATAGPEPGTWHPAVR